MSFKVINKFVIDTTINHKGKYKVNLSFHCRKRSKARHKQIKYQNISQHNNNILVTYR